MSLSAIALRQIRDLCRPEFGGVDAVYRREGEAVELTVRWTEPRLQAQSVGVVELTAEHRDLLCAAADLAVQGQPLQPRRGDRIESEGLAYEVTTLADGETYRHSDPQRQSLRIHCIQVRA